MLEDPSTYRIERHGVAGADVVDVGVATEGGLAAGLRLAEITLGGRGTVQLVRSADTSLGDLAVQVVTDHPVMACLGSQYAGWPVSDADYFGMGSGPMRLLRGREPILERLELAEDAPHAVGVIESAALPKESTVRMMAEACGRRPDQLTLLVAPTRSLAGTIQIVARSVETTLHKLAELESSLGPAPLDAVVSAAGTAPLPPPAGDDLTAIGRTNDAILYGAEVTLWVRGSLEAWKEIVPQIPSSTSKDYGSPFLDIFRRYDGDFYQIDPLLFSPARVRIEHIDSGERLEAGRVNNDLLRIAPRNA